LFSLHGGSLEITLTVPLIRMKKSLIYLELETVHSEVCPGKKPLEKSKFMQTVLEFMQSMLSAWMGEL